MPSNLDLEIDDMDHLDEFDKIAKSHQRVSEIVGILQLIRDGETDHHCT